MNKSKIIKLIVTYFGSGLSRICPGTVGSILTLPLWFVIIYTGSAFRLNPFLWLLTVISIISAIAYYSTKKYLEETKKEDPSEVVIDEVVGQLLAFLFSFSFLFFVINKPNLLILTIDHKFFTYSYFFIFPIILFRIYDIKKPWIIGKIDSKMKNVNGVILDDVVAGIFAGITNSVIMLIMLRIFNI